MVFGNGANPQQIKYLRRRLGVWREQLVTKSRESNCALDKGNSFDSLRRPIRQRHDDRVIQRGRDHANRQDPSRAAWRRA